jgi:hypothetical protein
MASITVQVPDLVADALTRQARALLLGRRAYVRAVLAAVASQADRDRSPADTPGNGVPARGEVPYAER